MTVIQVANSLFKRKFNLNPASVQLSLRQKIIFAFVSLLLVLSASIAFTLLKLTTVEENAISVIESQEPIATKMLSISQKVNHAIALLHEVINSNRDEDKLRYAEVEAGILFRLYEIQGLLHGHVDKQEGERLQQLVNEFLAHAKMIIELSYDFERNYPGVTIAADELNPLAREYLGLINDILSRDSFDLPAAQSKVVRSKLYELRFTWGQMINSFRVNFVNQLVRRNANTENLDNYLLRNRKVTDELRNMHIEIGMGDLERLFEIFEEYTAILPRVIEMQTSDAWRSDLNMMEGRIKPVVSELRVLLDKLVQRQLSASMLAGSAVTSNLQQIRIYTGILFVVAIVVSLLVGLIILRAIIPPLQNLMGAADRVSKGDLNSEVFITSDDEIGRLGRSFNAMVDSLRAAEINKQKYLTSLEQMNLELEARVLERTAELEESEMRIRTIHDNVGEGILLIGEDFQLETINRAALEMFGYHEGEILGKHAAMIFAELYDPKTHRCINQDRFQELMNIAHVAEIQGVRKNGEIFPLDMLITKMSIAGDISRVCIVRDITQRKEAEERLQIAQQKIVSAAHKSGMAEMATGVLHNIGNILNSVNISVEEVARVARNSKLTGLQKANAMLADNMDNIAEFIANDEKGRKLPRYFIKLGNILEDELDSIANEVAALGQKTAMMKEVINTQQAYATAGFLSETFLVSKSIEDALIVHKATLEKWGVKIKQEIAELPPVVAQKSRLLQVLTNLIKNAKEAMQDNDALNKDKLLTISAGLHNKNSVYISVKDTGCGIPEQNLSSIFQHGFTTKENGHGFGLHASANAMTEMGGTLTVRSGGVGMGASFIITVPVSLSELANPDNEFNLNSKKAG